MSEFHFYSADSETASYITDDTYFDVPPFENKTIEKLEELRDRLLIRVMELTLENSALKKKIDSNSEF